MKKTLVNLLKFAVSAVIISWLVYKARQDEHFSDLVSGPKDWRLLTAAAGLAMVAVVGTIVRWYFLVRALDLPFTLRDAFRLGFLGYLLNFVSVGSVGGDLFKAVFVAREYPGQRAKAVATVILDRVVGLFAMFVVASLALLLTGQLHRAGSEVREICQMTLAATAAGAVAITIVLFAGSATGTLATFAHRLPKVGPVLVRLVDALRLYRHRLRVLVLTLVLSLFIHSLATCSMYMAAQGLPGHAPSLATHFVAVPLANLTGLLPLPMSGIGAREAAIDFLYTHLPGESAVPAGKGFVVSLCFRLIEILIAAIGAIYYLVGRREVSRVLHESEQLAEGIAA